MDRRAFLRVVGAVSSGGLAGCAAGAQRGGMPSTPDSSEVESSEAQGGSIPSNFDLPVPESALIRGARRDGIPAVTDPVFGPDWSAVTLEDAASARGESFRNRPSLGEFDRIIGVERNGEARAYPLRILNWHEAVNDSFGGPLLVTFCPLCGSGVVGVRTVNGAETVFGVSGYLWHSDLVLYDQATGSLWSQILATAIRGPKTGTSFELVPASMTTWSAWQEDYPNTSVLLPPPISNTLVGRVERRYDRNPYADYLDTGRTGPGLANSGDENLRGLYPKVTVIGIRSGNESKAYPTTALTSTRVVNDVVGSKPVVVASVDETLVAYDRRVEGRTLTFERVDGSVIHGGGSRWNLSTGRAIDGPHMGARLDNAADRSPMFWFAWAAFNPDTAVYEA